MSSNTSIDADISGHDQAAQESQSSQSSKEEYKMLLCYIRLAIISSSQSIY